MSELLSPRYLEVWIYGELVGWLCEAGRVTRFVPAERYLIDKERPTLSLSLTIPNEEKINQEILQNSFHRAMYRERGELPPFFAGLLPEGPLRERLEATRKDKRDCDDFGVLAAAGEDLPGAVKIVPANIDNLTASARAIGVTGGSDNLEICVPEAATEGAASVSGFQNKIALSSAKEGRTYTLPFHGKLSDIIAKLPAPNNDSMVFNEYSAMMLAASAGVRIATCKPQQMKTITRLPELVTQLGENTHFLAVDRFDRRPGGPVHIEDGCQMLSLMPNEKYASESKYISFLRILDRISANGIEDVRQFFIRQVVNTLIGNCDAHLKNFSLIYDNGIIPQLSPAYDIVCVVGLPNFEGFATNVAIDKLQRQQTIDTYKQIAKEANISERIAIRAVKDAVEMAQDSWPDRMKVLNTPSDIQKIIRARLKTLPLANI
ncbi:HipA domain-containing protein [Undibacterium sp. RTI2.2]|uniref:type II toxin-antitoxin system HipA family toxin n=2 Tax=unclassified Undibacterium TaxID=2630295 RepID=UPI002B235605|nr:HipA domain-containing protein [Undibacterium sp. RTI2.2]MEB0118738.1 HipA domain-containing protein [Undibacterium sp. RTI2.2]